VQLYSAEEYPAARVLFSWLIDWPQGPDKPGACPGMDHAQQRADEEFSPDDFTGELLWEPLQFFVDRAWRL
jgi:hypothetical protein